MRLQCVFAFSGIPRKMRRVCQRTDEPLPKDRKLIRVGMARACHNGSKVIAFEKRTAQETSLALQPIA